MRVFAKERRQLKVLDNSGDDADVDVAATSTGPGRDTCVLELRTVGLACGGLSKGPSAPRSSGHGKDVLCRSLPLERERSTSKQDGREGNGAVPLVSHRTMVRALLCTGSRSSSVACEALLTETGHRHYETTGGGFRAR
ncbi:hypothetical protein VTO73DRAFT_9568 [Trametes versicolor]